jgi:hypothetical protein
VGKNPYIPIYLNNKSFLEPKQIAHMGVSKRHVNKNKQRKNFFEGTRIDGLARELQQKNLWNEHPQQN